ncbi:ATP-binding protein [Oscillatoria sp. FACHB-1407]|uniref:ATP-binding protein n=1 Tax=Oscillatoria sp. FACHB-1407 TaxID=2692847 RepID=UPI00281628C8|nr:ATP-binding protein [Oscillatoria sp. FACHB-1407]
MSDTGIGIRPDFLPSVFDRFTQAEVPSRHTPGGVGLGLAIARYPVELHHGTIEVASEGEGQGTTLTVRLPLRLDNS